MDPAPCAQIVAGIIIISFFNPLGVVVAPNAPKENIIIDRLITIWRNFRDLNACEFCVGIVMLTGAPICFLKRNIWLLRGLLAVTCYTVMAAIISPQPSSIVLFADVRYLAPLIPLCIGISALVILMLTRGRWYFALPVAVAVFGFNVLNYPFSPCDWSCRPADFIGELRHPRATSIGVAVKWINDHVGEGESIWVTPNLYEPSLMYHAPQATYAWHLVSPPEGQFASLPPVHFFSSLPPPNYFMVFGLHRKKIDEFIKILKEKGVDYDLVEILDIYWLDMTRPEIFWRSFRPIKNFDRQTEAVYVYRRAAQRPNKRNGHATYGAARNRKRFGPPNLCFQPAC